MEPVCVSPNTISHDYNNGVGEKFRKLESEPKSIEDKENSGAQMFATYDKNRFVDCNFEVVLDLLQMLG